MSIYYQIKKVPISNLQPFNYILYSRSFLIKIWFDYNGTYLQVQRKHCVIFCEINQELMSSFTNTRVSQGSQLIIFLSFDLIWMEKCGKISQLLPPKIFILLVQHLALIFFIPLLQGFFKHCCIEHCSVAKTEIWALVFFSFNQINIFACFWFCSFKEAGSLWIQGV